MAIADLVPDIREALGVSSSKDDKITRGVQRNISYLLRNYNFPEALTLYTTTALADEAQTIALPSNVGKIKAVRLFLDTQDPVLYSILKRREEGVLPYEGGPVAYYREGSNLVLDTPLDEAGYRLNIWYQTTSYATAETWITSTYADALFHRCVYEMAPMERKPEVQQIFAGLWQEDQVILAAYLNELEFGGMDLRMGNDEVNILTERYATS